MSTTSDCVLPRTHTAKVSSLVKEFTFTYRVIEFLYLDDLCRFVFIVAIWWVFLFIYIRFYVCIYCYLVHLCLRSELGRVLRFGSPVTLGIDTTPEVRCESVRAVTAPAAHCHQVVGDVKCNHSKWHIFLSPEFQCFKEVSWMKCGSRWSPGVLSSHWSSDRKGSWCHASDQCFLYRNIREKNELRAVTTGGHCGCAMKCLSSSSRFCNSAIMGLQQETTKTKPST